MDNQVIRFGHLVSAIPLISHELTDAFQQKTQVIDVGVGLTQSGKEWGSSVNLRCRGNRDHDQQTLTRPRVERAIPILRRSYRLTSSSKSDLSYQSLDMWTNRQIAEKHHREYCRQIVNFGGHLTDLNQGGNHYRWLSVARLRLMPTLSSCLLTSFSLASIARYRPVLGLKIASSPVNLLVGTFLRECDSIVMLAMRNLLYREEVSIREKEAV